MRQLQFGFTKDYKKQFGGSLLVGKRKTKRPLSVKSPLHLILKAEHKRFFKPGNRSLEKLIHQQTKKFGIRIYDLSLNWSHIHMLIKLERRADYVRFIRSLTSVMAQKIRSQIPDLTTVFSLRPFTRILSWGRDLKKCIDYIILNQFEAEGFVKRVKVKTDTGRVIGERRIFRL